MFLFPTINLIILKITFKQWLFLKIYTTLEINGNYHNRICYDIDKNSPTSILVL